MCMCMYACVHAHKYTRMYACTYIIHYVLYMYIYISYTQACTHAYLATLISLCSSSTLRRSHTHTHTPTKPKHLLHNTCAYVHVFILYTHILYTQTCRHAYLATSFSFCSSSRLRRSLSSSAGRSSVFAL